MKPDLKTEVDKKRREISSNNISMSIGELLNLYKDKELDIHPEFQRVFRWEPQQKSRLIESVLLGIPLPSIYVATSDRGVWEVIDGVQRLSTIFEFMGELQGPPPDETLKTDSPELTQKPPLVLEKTKHLPGLSGVMFETLDPTLKLEFKRARLDIKILAREEGASVGPAKFDLFERLNTYGTPLSPQEVRNCILVSLNPSLYRWLKDLSQDEHFRSCTLLPEPQLKERYDMDLALRFITLRGAEAQKIGDVHDFLREKMESIAIDKKFNRDREEHIFRSAFKLLDASLKENALRPWNVKLKAFKGALSLAAFEGLALSIGEFWSEIEPIKDEFSYVSIVKKLWKTKEYSQGFSGLRASERMVRVMPAGRRVVRAEIQRFKKAQKTKHKSK
ncbi:DUF262 domain-containing protein [Corallococcus exiguus]|uniref:DUF262 domain-containing protein n=1 Tax=Corallococcus exiguus TaxID=83462 RepID=UPI0014944437|nr:DUF262 domain-containing protein [Corallococcus exiguus]NPD26785.1 DUF262 domain-containing protein [Corallococcus exiguus]